MRQFFCVCACVAALSTPLTSSATSDATRVVLAGQQLPARRTAQAGAVTERARDLAIVVGLRLRHQDELAQILRELSDPASPRYHRYLTAVEFDERFGPQPTDVAAVVTYLSRHGLTVSHVSASQQLITATGPLDAVERCFDITIVDHRLDGATFLAPDREPAIPPELAATVSSIQGLESRTQLRANNTGPRIPPQDSTPYTPADIARVYNFTPLYDAGVRGDGSRDATIAIATAFGFRDSDVTEFWRALGIQRAADQLEMIPVGGATTRTIDETTLDVEWAGAMAPGAHILAYVGADSYVSTFTRVYDRIVSDNRAAVMTISWGLCERAMPPAYLEQTHAIFQKAAALGISVVAASGDSGAFDCGPDTPGVNYPASDPLVTAIGGTTLELDSRGQRGSERAWDNSGGGLSGVWQPAPWQMSFAGYRESADVAMNADPSTGCYVHHDGGWWQYGGTSLGAPIWAALLALTNQYRAQHHQATVGLAAPALCDVATQPRTAAAPLIDITAGDNGQYLAGAGWDHPTGWGVPDAWALATALTAAPSGSADGGLSLGSYLQPVAPTVPGTVHVNASLRCSHTRVTTTVRGLPAGLYRLAIDDTLVLEVAVGASGRTRVQVSGADPRGQTVALLDADGRTLFRSSFPTAPLSRVRMRTRMTNPGSIPGASGVVSYRSADGAEQFALLIAALPAGPYQLFADNLWVATVAVRANKNGRTNGALRFDSRHLTGPPSPVALRCQPLRVMANHVVMLELTATAPGTGICPAS